MEAAAKALGQFPDWAADDQVIHVVKNGETLSTPNYRRRNAEKENFRHRVSAVRAWLAARSLAADPRADRKRQKGAR
jgi:hypothetical protein